MSKEDVQLVALSTLSVGQKALVVAFSFDTEKGERIQQMGLSPGEQLEVMRVYPSGDPVEIKIRGYFVSLQKQEADHIMVKFF